MRTISRNLLDDNGEEQDFDAIPTEITTTELSQRRAGTFCGDDHNTCWVNIAERFPNRLVRCWFIPDENLVVGMVDIACSEEEAEEIESIAKLHGGSLRHNGCGYDCDSFQNFENE
jgi:hypothetical protein